MIKNLNLNENDIDTILSLMNNTYGYDYETDNVSIEDKLAFLEDHYSEQQNYPEAIILTKKGEADLALPAQFNGTMFLSSVAVNVETQSLGEEFGVERFKIKKIKKDQPGLIIIENLLEDSIPDLVVID